MDRRGTLDMMVPLSVEQYHKMIEAGILVEGAPISGRYAKMEPVLKGQNFHLLLPTGEYLDLPVDKILY